MSSFIHISHLVSTFIREQTYEQTKNTTNWHNIIQTHSHALWDWQYYVEYSIIQPECEEY